MHNEEMKFYPFHPSDEKTKQIETTPMPRLEQRAPFEVQALHDEIMADINAALEKYEDKRFEVTGVAVKIGLDSHNKPSIQLSDIVDGRCYALCIFPTDDFYKDVAVGDTVTVCANYLVMSNRVGIVMKHSELLKA